MQLEKIFDVIGCTEVQNASFAIFMLNEEAEHWWKTTRETLLFMDWLATHHAKVNCYSKDVTISISKQTEFVFNRIQSFPKFIFTLQVERL